MSEEQKKAAFTTVHMPVPAVTDLYSFITTSTFGVYIERRLGTWESYRTQIQEAIKAGCSYHSEIFRRSSPGLRKILPIDVLQTISSCDPGRTTQVYESLPYDIKVNIAAVVDLICSCPNAPGVVEWAGRQLTNIDVDWDDMLCHPEIKCVMLAYRREKWKSAKNPGDLCWGILMRDNTFHLFTTGKAIHELTKPEHRQIPVDIIAQSRSGRTVKVQRDLQKINVILVSHGKFNKELWEHQALRLRGLPFYYSFAAYTNPMPKMLLDAALDVIKKPGMMIARALLHPKVMKVQDSKNVISAFWTIFASCGRIHEFVTVVVALEFLRMENKNLSSILREESFMTVLYRVMIERCCRGYISEVAFPLCWHIEQSGQLLLEGEPEQVDPEKVFAIMSEVIDGLVAKADKIPPEMRHFASIVVNCVGLIYGTRESVMIALSRLILVWMMSMIMKKPKEFEPASALADSETLKNASILIEIVASFLDFGRKYPLLMRLNARMPQLRDTLSQFLVTIPVISHPVGYHQPAENEVFAAVDFIYKVISTRTEAFNEAIKGELLMRDNNPIAWGVMQFLMSLSGYAPNRGVKSVPRRSDGPKVEKEKAESGYNSAEPSDYGEEEEEEKDEKKEKSHKHGSHKHGSHKHGSHKHGSHKHGSHKHSPEKKHKHKSKKGENGESTDSGDAKKRKGAKASSESEDEKPRKSPARVPQRPQLEALPLSPKNMKQKDVGSSDEESVEEPPKKKLSKKAKVETSSSDYEAEESYFDDPRETKPRSARASPKAKRDTESSEDVKPQRRSQRSGSVKQGDEKPKKGSTKVQRKSSDEEAITRSRKGSAKLAKSAQRKPVSDSDSDEALPFKSARVGQSAQRTVQKKEKKLSSPIRPRKLDFSSDDKKSPKKSSKKRDDETESSSVQSYYEPSAEEEEKAAKTSAKRKLPTDAQQERGRKQSMSKGSAKTPERQKSDSDSESDTRLAAQKASAKRSPARTPDRKAKNAFESESDSEPAPKKQSVSKSSSRTPVRAKKDESTSESDSEPAPKKQSVSKASPRAPDRKAKNAFESESDSEPAPKKQSASKASPRAPVRAKKNAFESESDSEPEQPKKQSVSKSPQKWQARESSDSESGPKNRRASKGSAKAQAKKEASSGSDSSEPAKSPSRTRAQDTPQDKSKNSPRTLAASIASAWSDSSEDAVKPQTKSKPPLPPTPPRKPKPTSSDSDEPPKTPESKRSQTPSNLRSTTPDIKKMKQTAMASSDDSDELDSSAVFRSARRRRERRASQGLKSSAKKPKNIFSSSDSM